MAIRRLGIIVGVLAVLLVALGSCLQEDGGRCQLNEDCESNICCKNPSPATTQDTDGFCIATQAACNAVWGTDGGDTAGDASDVADHSGADADADAVADGEPEAEPETASDVPSDVPADVPADLPADLPSDVPSDVPSDGPSTDF